MGGPYLESGESIVLTTDRVSIDAVMYQALLTTRRLILIDSRNTRFEPQIIFLSAIQTVRSGKAATGEPVIILTLQEPAGTGTRSIIFSQEPAENRKPDRDLWLKTFIELSVSSRETKNTKEVPAAEGREGIRPTIRRWVAPDIIRPRTENFPVKEPEPEITIRPDEPEPVTIADEASTPVVAPVTDDDWQEEDGRQGYQDFLVRATRTAVQSLAEPETESPDSHPALVHPGHETPEPAMVSSSPVVPGFTDANSTSTLSVSILAAAKSLTDSNHQAPPEPVSYPPEEGNTASDEFPNHPYEITIRSTTRLPDNLELHPVAEITERPPSQTPTRAGDSAYLIPVYEVVAAVDHSTSRLPEMHLRTQGEPEPLSSQPVNPVEPEVNPEPVMEMSSPEVHLHAQEEETEKSLETHAVPPAHPSNPQKQPGSVGYPILITGGIILCLLLVIAGVLFLPGIHPRDPGEEIVIPAPVTTPTTVLTPISSTPSVPANGTWVRIVSAVYFLGQAGNPDSLQQISGSGEKWFRMRESTGLVKVSVEKQEDSGGGLRVEVYSDGRLITSRITSAPHGTVDLLIDPATGEAPGMTETPNPTGTGSRLEYL
jgi:hypothetical protein